MFNLTDLSLQLGGHWLLQQANLRVNPGDHIGLLGINGSGKTSLLKLLLSELEADTGEIQIPGGTRIAHARQEIASSRRTALEYVLDGDTHLRKLEQQLQQAELQHNGHLIASVHEQLDNIQAYTAPTRAAILLSGLGFNEDQHQQDVQAFSGGWRMRLNLAQALMCPSDLLLLDEPTNHLDLDAIFWLEDWLQRYPGTLVLISHDASFLNSVVSHIVHLEHQKLTLYKGDYDSFVQQRVQALSLQQSMAVKQQKEREHIETFISRFRAQATKAKQVQSRIKQLQKLEQVTLARIASPIQFHFKTPPKQPNPLFVFNKVSLGYTEPVLTDLNLTLPSQSRIGLIGTNGSGKSTFIKAITASLKPSGGNIHKADNLEIGYFSQHQIDTLTLTESALWHLQKIAPDAREQVLRDYLGQFNFRGSKVDDKIQPFSGGEKARLCLALIIWEKPNLLLLDEPTNHLDLDTRQALSLALQDYEGSMILVSHDRNLLSSCCDEFWLVENKKIEPFDGNLEDYKNWLTNKNILSKNALKNNSLINEKQNSRDDKLNKKRQQAETRKKLSPLKKKLSETEKEMESKQYSLQNIEQDLSIDTIYSPENKERLAMLLQQQAELTQQVQKLEHSWFEIHEELELLSGND